MRNVSVKVFRFSCSASAASTLVRLLHSEILLSGQSKQRDQLPEFQAQYGRLEGRLSGVERGNAPTTPARSSRLRRTRIPCAATEVPSPSDRQVGTAMQAAQWRERGLLKLPQPASCNTPRLRGRDASSKVL